MANDGYELTFTVNQLAASPSSLTHPTGGSWPAGTYSFKVVAWYSSGEGLEDNAGFSRADVTAWGAQVLDANDQVIITWLASARVPDHYSVYYVENATMIADGTTPWRKIAEVNGDVLTATIADRAIVTNAESTNFESTITTQDLTGVTLIDAAPDEPFNTNLSGTSTKPVKKDDSIVNVTDLSDALVVSVDSDTQITTDGLSGDPPADEQFEVGDVYQIVSNNVGQAAGETFQTDGVAAGDIIIFNADATYQDEYGTIAAIPEEDIIVTSAALSNSATFNGPIPPADGDFFDIVDAVFVPSAAARYVVVNPIKDQDPEMRDPMVKSYNGYWVTKSYAQVSPIDVLTVEAYMTTSFAALTDYQWLMVWQYAGVRLSITQSSGASSITTPLIGYVKSYNYMGDLYKNTKPVIRLVFNIEIGTGSSP